jgi:hypothetical protein
VGRKPICDHGFTAPFACHSMSRIEYPRLAAHLARRAFEFDLGLQLLNVLLSDAKIELF